MSASADLKCPVCKARFRGSVTCSRCGTDLTVMMNVAARAWAAREAARAALRNGDLVAAFRHAAAAQRLHSGCTARREATRYSLLK